MLIVGNMLAYYQDNLLASLGLHDIITLHYLIVISFSLTQWPTRLLYSIFTNINNHVFINTSFGQYIVFPSTDAFHAVKIQGRPIYLINIYIHHVF